MFPTGFLGGSPLATFKNVTLLDKGEKYFIGRKKTTNKAEQLYPLKQKFVS